MTAFDYDLFVIGAGSGGVRAARVAAKHGAKVAVAEEYRVGGTCVIRGCVPKKLLVYASKYAEEFEDAVGFGWTSEKVSFDWATLIANKDKEIDRLNKAYIRNLEAAGAELIMGRAEIRGPPHGSPWRSGKKSLPSIFSSPRVRRPSSRAICPAMNWRSPPTRPSISKDCRAASALSAAAILPSSSPESFQGLGVETILIYRGEQILRGFDEDLQDHLTAEMQKKGIEIRTRSDVSRIEKSPATGFA